MIVPRLPNLAKFDYVDRPFGKLQIPSSKPQETRAPPELPSSKEAPDIKLQAPINGVRF